MAYLGKRFIIEPTLLDTNSVETDFIKDGAVTSAKLADSIDITTLSINGTSLTATATELNLLDGITGIADEDDMSSDSAVKLVTQQSVKAYVDSQLATKDALSELTGSTDDVSEGSTNLYYTNARADARIALQVGTNLDLTNQDTDDLTEGSTNLYYTDTRANSAFDTRLGTKDTDNLSEGSTNQYYTNARADARIALQVGSNLDLTNQTTDDLAEGSTNLYATTANVTSAGALMDSEVTNLAQVKAFDSTDYATAAQGTTADSALQDLVDDTTPQLGGDLDGNGSTIDLSGNTEALSLPNGTTAQRPGTPNTGAIRWNSTDSSAEIYDGSDWGAVGGGGASETPYAEHINDVTAAFAIASGNNAVSGGPITVSSGGSVTVPSGSVWTIV